MTYTAVSVHRESSKAKHTAPKARKPKNVKRTQAQEDAKNLQSMAALMDMMNKNPERFLAALKELQSLDGLRNKSGLPFASKTFAALTADIVKEQKFSTDSFDLKVEVIQPKAAPKRKRKAIPKSSAIVPIKL